MDLINKLNEKLVKVEEYFAVLLAIAMIVVIFAQVVSRTFLDTSLSWSEELGRYIFVWLTFIGASIALQKGAHLGIDSFVKLFPEKVQKVVNLLVQFLILGLLALMIKQGLFLVERTAIQKSPAMRIPMSWPYYAIPTAAILMTVHTAVNIYNSIRGFFSPPQADNPTNDPLAAANIKLEVGGK